MCPRAPNTCVSLCRAICAALLSSLNYKAERDTARGPVSSAESATACGRQSESRRVECTNRIFLRLTPLGSAERSSRLGMRLVSADGPGSAHRGRRGPAARLALPAFFAIRVFVFSVCVSPDSPRPVAVRHASAGRAAVASRPVARRPPSASAALSLSPVL